MHIYLPDGTLRGVFDHREMSLLYEVKIAGIGDSHSACVRVSALALNMLCDLRQVA